MLDAITVPDHVARRLVPGECIRYLMRNPFGGRMCGDVDPDKISAVKPNDDEGIAQLEANRWDNECSAHDYA
jgi:hypothetical protein